jgi:RND family efflux transporter MFP subunit
MSLSLKHLPVVMLSMVCTVLLLVPHAALSESAPTTSAPRPSLTVNLMQATRRSIPLTLSANGSIAAWQEAIIGAEVAGLKLLEVRAQVGDVVRKGQVLAVFAQDSVKADWAQSQASLAEAEAQVLDARLDADRARRASGSSALSAQQVARYLASEKVAEARLAAAKAHCQSQQLRLQHTEVLASDDGIISARTATVGAVANAGEALFKLIRQQRLEWRAEVTAAEMAQLAAGVPVSVSVPSVGTVAGVVRTLAPTLDASSRQGLVYVDLSQAVQHGLRAGMFARGEFALPPRTGLSLPQQALSLREGFSYVFTVDSADRDTVTVQQRKVQLGRRWDDQVEIVDGLAADAWIVSSGAAFLTDGDSVKVVKP